MSDSKRQDMILYGRIIASVAMYAAFVVLGVSAVLTQSLADHPWLLSGLLILSVVVLPRSARQPQQAEEEMSDEEFAKRQNIHKWLTWSRLAYFLLAIFIFFGLPELV